MSICQEYIPLIFTEDIHHIHVEGRVVKKIKYNLFLKSIEFDSSFYE